MNGRALPTDVQLRRVARGDADAMVALYNGRGPESKRLFKPLGLTADAERFETIIAGNDGAAADKFDVLALHGSSLVGWAFLWNLHAQHAKLGIVVADGAGGRGVGDRLMAHLLASAAALGVGAIYLTVVADNVRAIRLYSRHGFETTREFVSCGDGQAYREMACRAPYPPRSKSSLVNGAELAGVPTSRFKPNLAANVVGAGWTALLQLACIPLLLSHLGAEAFGLVSFYLTLLVTLQVLDLGIGITVNREAARQAAGDGAPEALRDLVRTLELLYWAVGGCLAAAIFLLAAPLGTRWIHAEQLAPDTVVTAVRLMAVALLFQWPASFYQNGLAGLQALVRFNLIRIAGATLAYGGATALVVAITPDIRAFFAWFAGAGALQAVLLRRALWVRMPPAPRPARFDPGTLRSVRSFAGAMALMGPMGVLLTQMDKLALSRFASLEQFGYYAVAGALAGSLQIYITPVFSAAFPRLSALVSSGDEVRLRRFYHATTQVLAVLIIPTALTLASFAEDAVRAWTGSETAAHEVPAAAALLLLGVGLNGLMHMPHALRLAAGWTRFGLVFGTWKVALFPPFVIWAVARHGALGAAGAWALFNIVDALIGAPVTHRRLLRGEGWRWALRDIGAPLAAAAVVVLLARAALAGRPPAPAPLLVLELATIVAVATLAASLCCSEIRTAGVEWLRQRRFLAH